MTAGKNIILGSTQISHFIETNSLLKEADMSTVMLMEWSGLTQDQYNQVMRTLDLDSKRAAGAIFHVAGFTSGTLHVLDIWESQQALETFQTERLGSAVQ